MGINCLIDYDVLPVSPAYMFVCLLALSLSAHWHTYIHLKHENGDKWYKNGGWTITYIDNVYTRHV